MQTARPPVNATMPRPVSGTPALANDSAALNLLLRIEHSARMATDVTELRHLMANETRKLNRARQIFVVEVDSGRRGRITAASGISVLDPSSMLLADLSRLIGDLARTRGLGAPIDFALPAHTAAASDLATTYPFRDMLWVPFKDRKAHLFAGLLMARDIVWTESDIAVSTRLAETFGHAWRELSPRSSLERTNWRSARYKLATVSLLAVALALPVPMTALAPAEIVAADPMIVAAGIDGVIDSIDVEPGQVVKPGDILLRLADTALRNKSEIARREAAVAEARIKQATIVAMSDLKGRHELGLADAELELKRAELSYASDMLERTVVRAARAGIAAYADRKALIGRPVSTGERIMEIADPSKVEIRIDLPAADAIALQASSRVKLFLDVDPLNPRDAHVVRSDYKARPSDSDVLAFRTFAQLDVTDAPPRIGLRGTAQIYGPTTVLALYLFRRPLAAARQYLGL